MSHYRSAVRAQRHGDNGTSAKDALRGLAAIALIASGFFWFPIQWRLVEPVTWGETFIAISGGLFLVIAPPVLTAFLIPWSPAGMLLQKINARTWGSVVVIGASLYLLYYSFTILYSWWGARQVVAESNLTLYQSIIGVIAYILVPALLWAPVSSEEAAETLKQAQLVKRYEIQTAGEIAILQARLLWAQQKTAVGLANLTGAERAELAGTLTALIEGMDNTIQEIAGNLSQAAGVAMEFRSPFDDDQVPRLLGQVADDLGAIRMVPVQRPALMHQRPSDYIDADPAPVPPSRSDASEYVRTPIAPSVATTQHNAAQRRAADHTYEAARASLPTVWTTKDLGTALAADESTVRPILAEWTAAGLVTALRLRGRFSFTEDMEGDHGH